MSKVIQQYIKRCRGVRMVGIVSTIPLITILSLLIVPVNKTGDLAEAIGTASSTTITLTKASADLTLATLESDGTFASSTAAEMAQFGVKTTNYTGYTLTVEAADDTGILANTDSSATGNNTFSSISSVMDEKTFDNATYNGKWGYKPSKMKSVENVGFWPSPTTAATTLDVTEEANATDNNYTIALGARADYSQATGTYATTMILHATANPANYSVTYMDNTGDTITNLPDASTSTTSGTSITLSNVTPSRTGYVFAGWCDEAPTSAGTVCGGDIYTAGDTYPIDQTTSNIITLYATWEVPEYDITIKPSTGISSVSLNGQSCSNAAGCTVTNLTYGQNYTLTATVSNGYSFGAWSPEGAGTIANIQSASTTFTVGEGETMITAVGVGADAKAVTVNFAYAGGGTVGVDSVVFKESATGTTAGTVNTNGGTVSLKQGVGYTVTVTTPTSGEYGVKSYALNNASNGLLTSTAAGNTTYFTPNANSGSAVITVNTCKKIISGTSMQAYTTPLAELCDDATGTLTDSRNSKSYKVGVVTANNGGAAKTLWMTQNLSIGCNGASIASTTLTSATSNVSTNYTTPTASGHSNDYDNGKIVCSSDANTGAWYNYAAASAGTITGSSNTNTATSSVCPKGWQLPSHSQIAAAASNKTAFSPVAGGNYYGGTLYSTGVGHWWSNSTSGAANRWYLGYNSSYLYTEYSSRYYGFDVRCVRA